MNVIEEANIKPVEHVGGRECPLFCKWIIPDYSREDKIDLI
jgi:hypothetical protein